MSITKTNSIEDIPIIKKIGAEESGGKDCKTLFEVAPLKRGFGITLGNALRRVCLAHLEGTAVIALRVPGITHEFCAIKGVFEDSVELILNLKKIVFSTNNEEPFLVKIENFSGSGEILAKDLVLPAGVEVVDPNVYIATVTEKIDFSAEFLVSKGKGYVLSEEQDISEYGTDFIPLDSVFMPIKKFSYQVEQIRIGESSEASTNKFEKLTIEIVSNGSISPEVAIAKAAKQLTEQLAPFLSLVGQSLSISFGAGKEDSLINFDKPSIPTTGEPLEVEQENSEDYSSIGIETLHLSVRSYNCLKRAGINTVEELVKRSREQLLGIKNFGTKSQREIEDTLEKMGLSMPSLSTDQTQNTV